MTTSDEKDLVSIANTIAGEACQLYSVHPHKDMYPNAFSMYSYDRFTKLILEGMALQMLEQGSSVEHVRDVFASKHIRWMLDAEEETLTEFGQELAKKFQLHNVMVKK